MRCDIGRIRENQIPTRCCCNSVGEIGDSDSGRSQNIADRSKILSFDYNIALSADGNIKISI
jgi:hypothetical protein